MEFEYDTVKYLIIILSILILGYLIFIIYTDLTTVRRDLSKVKTRLFDTCVSLEELQKDIQYVENNSDNSDNLKENEQVLHDILNNNFFSPKNETESENTIEEPVNINSFSFNIPYFNKNKEQQNNLSSIEEISESGDVLDTQEHTEEEIKFEKSLIKCQGIIASGKNKGKECSKYAVVDSDFCSKHTKVN